MFLSKKKINPKIWSRSSVIPNLSVNTIVSVYDGHEFKRVAITNEKMGFKLGEFSHTRKFLLKKKPKNLKLKKSPVRVRVDTVIGVEFRTIPWEQLEAADLRDCTVWKDRALKVTTMIRQMNYSEYEKTFHKRQLAMLVFDSNQMEGTISTRLQQGSIMNRIMELISVDMPEPPVVNLVDIVLSIRFESKTSIASWCL